MAKARTRFLCRACGAVAPKWAGQCEACGAWNTLEEDLGLGAVGPAGGKALGTARGRGMALAPLAANETPPERLAAGMGELDRVLGGGLVAGSAVLVGGDPGIGKSTLLLQATAAFAARLGRGRAVYVSGEEAMAQVRLRAARLGLAEAPVLLAAETGLRDILTTLDADPPALAVIDSIQTLWLDTVESAPGSVAQLRAAVHELVAFAKRRGTAVLLVGHVTKEGQIAGPRTVEHMVDTVLYFEGERGHEFRILRAVKNRFGPADEIGVFQMTGSGLAEVPNPSALFLGERGRPAPGTVVFAGIEGTRPLLTEFQALVAPSSLGTPRRTVVGWDSGRLAMTLAVLEARAGLSLAGHDVYMNVAGGLRIGEPAADLAAAAALVTALTGTPLPPETVVFGEISLSGALRPVSQTEARLREAAKLGFEAALLPSLGSRPKTGAQDTPARGVEGIRVNRVADLAGFVTTLTGDRSDAPSSPDR
ncbi:MAG: DNA repair protein RadA [Pseudomonadota bacterium]